MAGGEQNRQSSTPFSNLMLWSDDVIARSFSRNTVPSWPWLSFHRSGKTGTTLVRGDVVPVVLVDILEHNGNDEEVIDEIHTVGDYDEDENDEYGDN